MQLTIKEAVDRLASTPNPFGLHTIRAAIRKGKLQSQLIESYPSNYYVVKESDLLAWASDPLQHKAGNPSFRKATTHET